MQHKIQKIGVMTSGGDCGGLNAAIRAIVQRAVGHYGWQVFGIKQGSAGLMKRPLDVIELTPEHFNGTIMRQAGTILGAISSGNPFYYNMPDGSKKDKTDDILAGYNELGLDAMITIGGDGSLKIAQKLARRTGIKMVGIPKTIDNDVCHTEAAIGFDSAVEVAVEALDRLQPTAASHNRIMILEVMGRDAGHIALNAGVAGGADIIVIPEVAYDLDKLAAKIKDIQQKQNRNYALVVVSEAVKMANGEALKKKYFGNQARYGGIGDYLAAELSKRTKTEARVTVLGHVQRGAEPSVFDRKLASAFGVHATDLIATGDFEKMVGWKNNKVVAVPMQKVINKTQKVDTDGILFQTAKGLGISFGDG